MAAPGRTSCTASDEALRSGSTQPWRPRGPGRYAPSMRTRTVLTGALQLLRRGLLGLVWLWTVGALAYASVPVPWVRTALALLFAAAVPALFAWRRARPAARLTLLGGFLVALLRLLSLEPSNDRDWVPREARTAWAEVDGSRVTVHEVRDARYRTDEDADVRWETRTYDLEGLESVWFLVDPFRGLEVAAHTFVSFGFADGRYLAVSIEARKERGEEYGILPGLYRQFEVIYVAGDERDLIGLRTHVRGDTVYL